MGLLLIIAIGTLSMLFIYRGLDEVDAALRFEAAPPAVADESTLTLREFERRHIERVLADTHGKVEPAARRLGISRSSLYQKLKEYGLGPSRD